MQASGNAFQVDKLAACLNLQKSQYAYFSFQHQLHGQLHAHAKEKAAAQLPCGGQGDEEVQGQGDDLAERQEQVLLDHYYEDFEGTETASIAFDNRSTTLRSTTITMEGEDTGDIITGAASADVGISDRSFELPMTEQNFTALTQKVCYL